MIQAQIPPNQETPPHQISDLLDPNSLEYPEEYEEEDSQDFYQDEDDEQEETEGSPTVYYNLPNKKPDPKQEQLKVEKLKERNQQILEKKEQAKHHPIETLNLLETSENDHFSFRKVNRLARLPAQANLVFEIPDKNLLVILLQDCKTVNVYNTLNFKLVKVTKAQKEVKCMSYCKKLGRIIVGGASDLLQLWSPKTFEIEAECLRMRKYETILSVTYAAKSNVIVAKTAEKVLIYNTGLRFVASFSLFCCSGSWYSDTAEIFSLSKNLLLVVSIYGAQKGVILINTKTGNRVDCSKTVFIPSTSHIVMTEKAPVKIFSCLGILGSKPVGQINDKYLYPLIQFTIDTKKEELVPVRRSEVSKQTFSKLNRIENTNYFLAERFENSSTWKTCLLSINKDQIEIIKVISKPAPITLTQLKTYTMLKDGLSVVEVNKENLVTVYKGIVHREKPQDSS